MQKYLTFTYVTVIMLTEVFIYINAIFYFIRYLPLLQCDYFKQGHPRTTLKIYQQHLTVAHKCNGETKSHGKTNFNSRHNKINLQSKETSRQNKTNSRQNNINSRQNKISSRQNKNQLTAKYTLTHGKIESTHGKT